MKSIGQVKAAIGFRDGSGRSLQSFVLSIELIDEYQFLAS